MCVNAKNMSSREKLESSIFKKLLWWYFNVVCIEFVLPPKSVSLIDLLIKKGFDTRRDVYILCRAQSTCRVFVSYLKHLTMSKLIR